MDLPSKDELPESVFENYEEIPIDETPSELKWVFPAMYKISQTEGELYWRVGFDGSTDDLVTEHGYSTTSTGKAGKWQIDRLKLYTNNLHKVIVTKALQDAKKRYNDKILEGYSDEAGNVMDLPRSQLAKKYPLPGQTGVNPLKPIHFKRGIAVQAKLNGVRARVWKINNEIKVYSREFHEYPWLTIIREEVKILFDYLPRDFKSPKGEPVGLDGELYNHDYTLNVITSIVRTGKTKHDLNDKLQYHIFDLILLETDFETRFKILTDAYLKATAIHKLPHIVLVGYN